MKIMDDKSGRRVGNTYKSDVIGSSETASSRSTPSTSRSSTPNNVKDQGREYDSWRSIFSQISPLAKNDAVALAMQSIDMEGPNEELKEECLNHVLTQFEEFKQDLADSVTSRLSERLQAIERERIHSFSNCLEKCDRKMRFELVTEKLLFDDWNEIRENIEQRRTQLYDDNDKLYTELYADNFCSSVDSELRRSMKHYQEEIRNIKRTIASEGRLNNKVRLEVTEANFQSYASTYEQATDRNRNVLKTFVNDHLKQETMKREAVVQAAFERDAKTIRRELEQLKKTIGEKKLDRSSICVIL